MSNLYLGITGVIALLVIIVLIWLMYEQLKFKKTVHLLSEIINRNSQDVAGLCAAAITVDERLKEYDEVLKGLQAKIADFKQAEVISQPYGDVIQKIQTGTSVAELMQNFGLSGDEAALLIRLHGPKIDLK
jgi:hypothetical protein